MTPLPRFLNDSASIAETAQEISFCVNGVLSEGLEDVYARIEDDFATTDGDGMEVINPLRSGSSL